MFQALLCTDRLSRKWNKPLAGNGVLRIDLGRGCARCKGTGKLRNDVLILIKVCSHTQHYSASQDRAAEPSCLEGECHEH